MEKKYRSSHWFMYYTLLLFLFLEGCNKPSDPSIPASKAPIPNTQNVKSASNNKVRKELALSSTFKLDLLKLLPQGYRLGEAYDNGDCFFDALAQWVNRINDTDINNVKYLRGLCHEFYLKNKDLVDGWNKKDYGGIDKGKEDYYFIQYTAEECEQKLHARSSIWGRTDVEGIILCKELKLQGILSIEVLKDPNNPNIPVISYHLTTQNGYRPSIDEEEGEALIEAGNMPILINVQDRLHFVPLISIENNNPIILANEKPKNPSFIEKKDKGKEKIKGNREECSIPKHNLVYKNEESINESEEKKDTTKLILSLDGGGIRGLLQAYVLNHIEKTITKQIIEHFGDMDAPTPEVRLGEYFDLIAGTSTGGIIGLGMRVIDPTTNRPEHSMRTILSIYEQGDKIFPNANAAWKSCQQLCSYKHNPTSLENVLVSHFKNATLADLNQPTLVTAYNLAIRHLHCFKSYESKNDKNKNFYLRDAARATSAAPTYFPSASIKSIVGKQYSFIDGGVASANDPIDIVCREAKDNLYQGKNPHFISIGTGYADMPKLNDKMEQGGVVSAVNVIEIQQDSSEKQAKESAQSIINDHNYKYTRVNFEMDSLTKSKMDDASSDNKGRLAYYAQKAVENNDALKIMLNTITERCAKNGYYTFLELINEVRKQLQDNSNKINLSQKYLHKLRLPYVTARARWEINNALNSSCTLQLSRVTHLDLSGNVSLFKNLDSCTNKNYSLCHLSKFPNLTYLDISNTDLKEIKALQELKKANLNLEILKAKGNFISCFSLKITDVIDATEGYKISYFDGRYMSQLVNYYKNKKDGLNYYKESIMDDMAKETIGTAEYNLGKLYENNWGLGDSYNKTTRYKKAFGWYKEAAEQGNVEAQFKLGEFYNKGLGVEKDKQQALYWYHAVAEATDQEHKPEKYALYQCALYQCAEKLAVIKKHAIAQFILGVMCEGGVKDVVDQNYEEAFKYYLQAAEQGLPTAQFKMGEIYEKGVIVGIDIGKAREWYKKAGDHGEENAQSSLKRINKLGPAVASVSQQTCRSYQKVTQKNVRKTLAVKQSKIKSIAKVMGACIVIIVIVVPLVLFLCYTARIFLHLIGIVKTR
jgi:patatin-like phospholipase/acyl hydrolase/TPR repeat protein